MFKGVFDLSGVGAAAMVTSNVAAARNSMARRMAGLDWVGLAGGGDKVTKMKFAVQRTRGNERDILYLFYEENRICTIYLTLVDRREGSTPGSKKTLHFRFAKT